ncbi:MAG: hypothetical protein IJN42_03230 [Clostridia bacterium]|nr:hypothetical protein [Clostridia bacterium]
MKNQSEFKALVQQKMNQQAYAAHHRNQRLSALGASAIAILLVVGLGWYFLNNPIQKYLRPEDNIPESDYAITTNNGAAAGNVGGNASGNVGGNESSATLPPTVTPPDESNNSGGSGSSAGTAGGSMSSGATAGGNSSSGGFFPPESSQPTPGSDRTIPADKVTAVEYRFGKQTAGRSTDKNSIKTFLTAMVERKQQSFAVRTPYTYTPELTLTFYDGEEILLTVILTEKQEMLCQFSRYVTECVQLSEKDYEDLYDLAPTPYSTPIKGEKIPVAGTVFDTASLTLDSKSVAIEGAEIYSLYNTINAYFPENRQRKVTFRATPYRLVYAKTSDPANELIITFDKSTGALRWEYAGQQMTVALDAALRKQLTRQLDAYLK